MSRLLDEMSRAERRRRELADEEAQLAQAAAEAARNERQPERWTAERAVASGSAVERAWQHAEREHATPEDEGRDDAPAPEEVYAAGTEDLRDRGEIEPYALQPERGLSLRRRTIVLAALAGVVAIGAAMWTLSRGPQPADAVGQQADARAKALTTGAGTAASGVYMVEVATLRDSAQAAALQQKVAQVGLRGHSENVAGEAGDMIRVHAGPYATAELAEAARERLSAAGLDAQVVVR